MEMFALNGLGCNCNQPMMKVTQGGLKGLNGAPPVINWDTAPDTSADGRKVEWTSNDWINWHKKIAAKYGIQRANEVTQQWWDRLGVDTRKVTWWFNCAFYDYFRKAGGGWSSIIPAAYCTVTESGGALIDAAGNIIENTADAADSTVKVLKYAIPIVLGLALLGIGVYVHKNYIKGNKRVKVGPATV